jgi:proteasome alpha subunit
MGGADEVVAAYLKEHYTENASLSDALHVAVAALGKSAGENGAAAVDRVIAASDLEVAVLDRTRTQPRKFLRLLPARLEAMLGDRGPTTPPPDDARESEIDPADIPDEATQESGQVEDSGTSDS